MEQWISLNFDRFFELKNGKLIHYTSFENALHITTQLCIREYRNFHSNTYSRAMIKCLKPKVCISKITNVENTSFSIYADRYKK